MPLARERFPLRKDKNVRAAFNIQQSDNCMMIHFHAEQIDKINAADVVF